MVWPRLSAAGWLPAQSCRPSGAPVRPAAGGPASAAVAVSEDRASGGQCWSRLYGRASGHPQVIHSAKSFAGPTGIVEHIGGGFGMALTVRAERSEEHTSELQSLMRNSYAVFCLKKKKSTHRKNAITNAQQVT